MDAAEIAKRLEAAGLIAGINYEGWVVAKALPEQWTAFLPTSEERLALAALRAGYGANEEIGPEGESRWYLSYDVYTLPVEHAAILNRTHVDEGDLVRSWDCSGYNTPITAYGRSGYDTPLIALAAAARVLGLEG